MANYTFGTGVNPAHFVEIPSGATNPPPRPSVTLTLKCRNSTDLSALPDQAVDAITGYFGFSTVDVPFVDVSADGGTTWVPIIGIEAEKAGANAGVTASQALALATQANVTAQQALAAVNAGGITFLNPDASVLAGPARTFTLAQLGVRRTADPVASGDVTGLQPVATSGLGRDLGDAGLPNGPVMLDDAGFVPDAALRAGGGGGSGLRFIFQNADGSWPARTTVSTDPTERVEYIPAYNPNNRPAIGVDAASAFQLNASLLRPGDVIDNLLPAA